MTKIYQFPQKTSAPCYSDLKSLKTNHKKYHPKDALEKVPLGWKGAEEVGAYFRGNWVTFVKPTTSYPKFPSELSLLDVAIMRLEQVFGKDYDPYVTDWGCDLSEVGKGRTPSNVINWDHKNDSIVVKTREGFTLSMQGTNLIEAAILLPRFYREALSHPAYRKKGIKAINVRFDDPREYSIAASPLSLWCYAGNCNKVDKTFPSMYDAIVKGTIERAIRNEILGA